MRILVLTENIKACSYLSNSESDFICQNLQLAKIVDSLSVIPKNLPCPTNWNLGTIHIIPYQQHIGALPLWHFCCPHRKTQLSWSIE
jgi:hypothetical protein